MMGNAADKVFYKGQKLKYYLCNQHESVFELIATNIAPSASPRFTCQKTAAFPPLLTGLSSPRNAAKIISRCVLPTRC